MRTKSQGNEVILSTYYHSNLIRTTPLLIEFCQNSKQKSTKLSYNIYYKTHSQLYMRPTINPIVPNLHNVCQLTVTITAGIVPFPFVLLCKNVHSFTLQNFTNPKLAFSVYNLSKPQMQSEHQFY